GGGQERTHGGPQRLSLGLLRAQLNHPGGQTGVARTAGSHGPASTELFERYQRSERALVAALAEMYVQGVSTRKVKAITEELCGHSFSASSISTIKKRLDQSLAQFATRPLNEVFPYLIVDARYERG